MAVTLTLISVYTQARRWFKLLLFAIWPAARSILAILCSSAYVLQFRFLFPPLCHAVKRGSKAQRLAATSSEEEAAVPVSSHEPDPRQRLRGEVRRRRTADLEQESVANDPLAANLKKDEPKVK